MHRLRPHGFRKYPSAISLHDVRAPRRPSKISVRVKHPSPDKIGWSLFPAGARERAPCTLQRGVKSWEVQVRRNILRWGDVDVQYIAHIPNNSSLRAPQNPLVDSRRHSLACSVLFGARSAKAYHREGMGSVVMDRVDTRTTESMAEMAERMSKELRAEMHNSEVQLSHWVAEREQRLGDIQVGMGGLLLFCGGSVVACQVALVSCALCRTWVENSRSNTTQRQRRQF